MKPLLYSIAAIALATVSAVAQEGSFDRSLSVSGPVNLEVKTDSGGIKVRNGSGSTVRVHAYLKADHGWFGGGDATDRIREIERNPPVEQNGNQIRIGFVHDRNLLRGISMRFEIETPEDTQVHARADSGGVGVEGVRGPVDAKTDSGGIHVENVKGEVHAAADSGGVHLANISGAIYARADSGGIEASDIGGGIDAQTDSGSVHLSQTQAGPIRAKADSGGISIKLAPKAGYDVSIETDSGHISIPEMTVHSSFSSHHVEGKVRGGGPSVDVRASSGSVSVE